MVALLPDLTDWDSRAGPKHQQGAVSGSHADGPKRRRFVVTEVADVTVVEIENVLPRIQVVP